MPGSHKRHTSKVKQSNPVAFLSLVDDLGSDLEFCSNVMLVLTEARHVFLNESIRIRSIIHGFTFPPTADPLQVIKSQLGRYDATRLSPSALHLQHLLRTHSMNQQSAYRWRHHVSSQLGLSLKAMPNLPIHRLKRRPEMKEYPPRNHFVLENPDEPIPPPLKLKDPTCNYCDNFHVLDLSQLSFTLSSDQSAIFIDDDTEEIVAVVIRDLAKNYFSQIGEWGVNLIQDSIKRRSHFCQRNNPGILARVGVSEGPRQCRLFGWVRNLKEKFKTALDKVDHDQSISSLFGIFYALLRSQASWLTEKFENVMSPAHLPRLDPNHFARFTIPLQPPVTFHGYPLAPPEGYIAIDFVKQIHQDNHWDGCPWGCYWNLCRRQAENKVGLESGASFFISNYALRIANASNTCVIWDISMWHGTAWYYNNASHIGISTLLSKATQVTWEKYKEMVLQGELQDGDLLWYPE
jgi:hypothetical protein